MVKILLLLHLGNDARPAGRPADNAGPAGIWMDCKHGTRRRTDDKGSRAGHVQGLPPTARLLLPSSLVGLGPATPRLLFFHFAALR